MNEATSVVRKIDVDHARRHFVRLYSPHRHELMHIKAADWHGALIGAQAFGWTPEGTRLPSHTWPRGSAHPQRYTLQDEAFWSRTYVKGFEGQRILDEDARRLAAALERFASSLKGDRPPMLVDVHRYIELPAGHPDAKVRDGKRLPHDAFAGFSPVDESSLRALATFLRPGPIHIMPPEIVTPFDVVRSFMPNSNEQHATA